MRVGVVGLGKLGLPVALALESAGHEVKGWDESTDRRIAIIQRNVPEAAYEPDVARLLAKSNIREPLVHTRELCAWADIILVCVQTPHEAEFEGATPLRNAPQDFDYSYLRSAVAEIANVGTSALVVIVSTCLPGTFERELRPVIRDLRVAYHPLFIAMGSVMDDFCDPEFILVGYDKPQPYGPVELLNLYAPVLGRDYPMARYRRMSITSAEMTKVAYNAAIGFKLLLANTMAMMADRVGANADDVMDTLKLAERRLVSPAYMTPGMGDGGGCHPRDQIAMSWLARNRITCDPFADVVRHRETHARWLANIWVTEAGDLPLVMLGEDYKHDLPLATGSHARLVKHYGYELARLWDRAAPVDESIGIEGDDRLSIYRACYFLGCPHEAILLSRLAPGSVLIDPWGVMAPISESLGVRVVCPGRRV